MFQRARRRLSLLYLGLFALVLAIFSAVFYVAFRAVLGPAFDITPDLTSQQAAGLAYRLVLERVGIALVVANVLTVGMVGAIAWALANRTLRPIQEVHKRQRRFVADASHEMKTPLAAIRATAEVGLGSAAENDVVRSGLATIIASTDRLTRITNDLLLLARTDDQTLDTPAEVFDLSVTVAEAAAAFRLAHPDSYLRGIQLDADLRTEGDPANVERIVANLLDNAFRYGGPNVAVAVSTTHTEREVILEVKDSGPGISPADLGRIFEPFFRVRSDSGGPEGNGLGLAIARSLAERGGGRLEATSQPGEGATFRLALPRVR